jgi:undecaprenyl-diphosphatase
MLDEIIALDKNLFVFLNGLGSETFDGLWLVITKQLYWTPFFLVVLFLILKKIGFKINFFLVLLFAPVIYILFYLIYKIIKSGKDDINAKKYAIANNSSLVVKLYQLFLILVTIALLILFTDQVTNFFKYSFERLRPCNDEELKGLIRVVKTSSSFSFFSGHAANSMATMTFLFLYFKNHFRFTYLLFLFPLIFAYSRIYLGLHFPLDIITGYVFGALSALLFYKFFIVAQKKLTFQF